jgi:outer membrane protein assembly factor BamB
MTNGRKWWMMAAAALAALAPAPPALGGANTYSTRVQTIRVGVLIADRTSSYSTGGVWTFGSSRTDAAHTFAYVFHALNARPDIRPYSWELVNPTASPYMTANQAKRWGIATGKLPNQFDPDNPPRLNKNMGAYWEVPLHETSSEQLAQYDVLYMPPLDDPYNNVSVEDRDKLMRAVDSGVTLWLDNKGSGSYAAPSATKVFVQTTFRAAATTSPISGDPLNPLLSSPYPLQPRELRALGRGAGILDFRIDSRQATLMPAIWSGSRMVAGYIPYGQGAIVVTASGIGDGLTSGFGAVAGSDTQFRGRNTGPVSGSDTRFISSARLKFLVNLISLSFNSPQTGRGPRHSSESRQQVYVPLGRKWNWPLKDAGNFAGSVPPFVSDPAVWSGVVVAACADGNLYCFDSEPERDLDGDGNPDDGVRNPDLAGVDIIWKVPIPTKVCSSVTLVPAIDGFGYAVVMLSDGRVMGVRVLPRSGFGASISKNNNPEVITRKINKFGDFPTALHRRQAAWLPYETQTYRIPAPVYWGGRLFVVGVRKETDNIQQLGIGAVAELSTSTNAGQFLQQRWMFPDETVNLTAIPANQTKLGIPSATPTVATIRDKGYSGATDVLLLVPTLSIREALDNLPLRQESKVWAFPIATRGERLVTGAPDGGAYTRFSGNDAIQVDESTIVVTAGGQSSYSGNTMLIDPGNRRQYVLATMNLSGFDVVRADYDYLPGKPLPDVGYTNGYSARWSLSAYYDYTLSTDPRFLEILTSPVVTPSGGVYFVASDCGNGSGRGPEIRGYEMATPSININPQQTPSLIPPASQMRMTFYYNVGVCATSLGAQVAPERVVLGTPATDRGLLFVPTATFADASGSQSRGEVLGFHVENTKFGLLLKGPVSLENSGISILIRNPITGEQQTVSSASTMWDVENVTVQGQLRGLITFRMLSAGTGAPAIDLACPQTINVTFNLLDPTTGQSVPDTDLAPQVYYSTPRGSGTDRSLLMAFSASVPSQRGAIRTNVCVAGGNVFVGADDGQVYTMPVPTAAEVLLSGANVGAMRPATFPWLGEVASIPNPWPPLEGLRATPVVANDMLVQNTRAGLYTFYSPKTLITDGNRVLEVVAAFDPKSGSGGITGFTPAGSEVVWSLDSTTQTRDWGPPGRGQAPFAETELVVPRVRSLNRPTMAIRVNSINTLIADTGNNRVVEVDRSGLVVSETTEFADPDGLLEPNEPTTLNAPTSVQRWETYMYDDEGRVAGRTIHTLICDSGNNRILEIVSRFSPDPAQWQDNVLAWIGRAPKGQTLTFYQAQREPFYKPGDDRHGSLDYGRTIASVVNATVNSAEVRLDEAPYNNVKLGEPPTPGGSIVILGGILDEGKDATGRTVSAAGKIVYYLNRMRYGASGKVFPLARPVFFQRYTTGEGAFEWRLMMTDGTNVFELVKRAADEAGIAEIPKDSIPLVGNMKLGDISGTLGNGGQLGTGGYTSGTVMAQRLGNGNVLMVNRQTGYVLEFNPNFDPSDLSSIVFFLAPPVKGTGALSQPTYAERVY